jgi:hypothetical protein
MASASNPQGLTNPLEKPRPGLVTFAAAMLFLLGGFQLMYAILEFANATWVAINVAGTFGGPLWLWGIIDLLFAIIVFGAASDILRGGQYGRTVGLIIAGLSALRWFFYIPAAPWVAAVVIAVDILIIYALVAHGEFFRPTEPAR